MTDYDTIFDEYMDSQLSTNTFLYKNPLTNEVKQGIGPAPLNWGEYPDGVEVNSEQAKEYDLFRSNYLPLPHEVYAKENIDKIKKMPEGSQITDNNWIVASKILHDYLNRSKIAKATKDKVVSPSGTAGLAGANVTIAGNEEFKTKALKLNNADEYAKWGINFMSAFDYNMAALAINVSQLDNAPENVLKSMYYLMETADREGMQFKNFTKGLFNVATDPFNLVGLGTLGIGVAGKYTGQQMTKAALKEILKGIVLSKPSKVSSVVGAEAMLYSAVDNYARQDIKIDAKQQENLNLGEMATAATVGAVVGERIGAGLPSVIEGARRGIVDLGKQADNYLKGTDDGATLTSGVDPIKPIAKTLSITGKALDTEKVIDKDEYGFYSKAFEEAKNLKQEKGTNEQMKQQLLKAGVKEDEMKWTGLNNLFEDNEKITKEEIVNHLKDNRVEIKEKTLALRDEDINYDEGELDFQLDETESWIHDEEMRFVEERIYDDITHGGEYEFQNIIENITNYQRFGLKKADGSVEFQGDTDGMVNLFDQPVIKVNPNQLTFEGIEQPKEVIFKDLIADLLWEKWEKDGSLNDFNNFLINDSVNPLANRVVLAEGIVDNNGQDNKIQTDLEELIYKRAEEEYYNKDYGNYIETYTANVNDDFAYKIQGNDQIGWSAWEDGIRLGDYYNDHSFEEIKIRLQTKAFEDGYLRFPDEEYLEDYVVDETNLKFKIDGPPQYANPDWQEPGGENYREILFTNENYKTLSGKTENVRMDHFAGYNNILAHVRAKDRFTPNGEKVLYLEEVQSDWAKIGRNRGYRIEDKKELAQAKETIEKLEKEFQAKKDVLYPKLKEAIIESNSKDPSVTESSSYKYMMEDVNKLDSTSTDSIKFWSGSTLRRFLGDFNKVAYPEVEAELKSLAKLADERNNLNNSIESGDPEGPFVSDVNKWGGMVMKRIIRMAKDQGYDYVAWSPGEVHIPRYNLSQVAKELIVTKAKQPEGSNQLDTFNITAKTHHGGERNFEIKESQLSDAVGSTLATNIIESLKKDNMVSYKGDDLEVTNPGMVGFYNKALPSLTNNLLKKVLKSSSRVEKIDVEIGGYADVQSRNAFKITDDLKSKVDKGISLFTPTTAIGAGVTAKEMENNQERANGNTY